MVKPNSAKYKSQFLDPNHTHFILSDNSTIPFGGEVEFRARIESEISRSFSIPIVVLVLGGGPRTVNTVRASLEKGNPCVFLEVIKKELKIVIKYSTFQRLS